MNCARYQAMIEAYESGELESSQLELLIAHAESCPSCRAAFDACRKTETLVRSAFRTTTSPAAAREMVLARIEDVSPAVAPAARIHAKRWHVPVAAAAALLIGVMIGAAVTRWATAARPAGQPVALSIAKLNGTVLQKHKGSSTWAELTPDARLYVGDDLQTLSGATLALALQNKSTMRLEGGTNLLVKEYNGEAEFVLGSGSLRATLTSPHPSFVIRTPQGLIRALGTDFAVSVQ